MVGTIFQQKCIDQPNTYYTLYSYTRYIMTVYQFFLFYTPEGLTMFGPDNFRQMYDIEKQNILIGSSFAAPVSRFHPIIYITDCITMITRYKQQPTCITRAGRSRWTWLINHVNVNLTTRNFDTVNWHALCFNSFVVILVWLCFYWAKIKL